MDDDARRGRARPPRSAWAIDKAERALRLPLRDRPTRSTPTTRRSAAPGRDGEPAEAVLLLPPARTSGCGASSRARAGRGRRDRAGRDARRRARSGPVEPADAARGDRAVGVQARRPPSPASRTRARSRCCPTARSRRADDAAARRGGPRPRRRREEQRRSVRPLARRDDARLRRDRRLPARVPPHLLRRAVRAAVRATATTATPGRVDAATPERRAVRGRRPRRARRSGARASSSATTTTRWSCCSTRSATRRSRSSCVLERAARRPPARRRLPL